MRWDVVKSFLARTAVSGVFAALAYATDHVVDLGASADNAALIAFGLSYVVHAVHAFVAKFGIDLDNMGGGADSTGSV